MVAGQRRPRAHRRLLDEPAQDVRTVPLLGVHPQRPACRRRPHSFGSCRVSSFIAARFPSLRQSSRPQEQGPAWRRRLLAGLRAAQVEVGFSHPQAIRRIDTSRAGLRSRPDVALARVTVDAIRKHRADEITCVHAAGARWILRPGAGRHPDPPGLLVIRGLGIGIVAGGYPRWPAQTCSPSAPPPEAAWPGRATHRPGP